MNENDLDEQLDRALQRRAYPSVPAALEERLLSRVPPSRKTHVAIRWWGLAMAASLLLGIALWQHEHLQKPSLHETDARQLPPASQPPTPAPPPQIAVLVAPLRHPAKPSHPRPLDAITPDDPGWDVGMRSPLTPTAWRVAQETASCATVPCSCEAMCRVSTLPPSNEPKS